MNFPDLPEINHVQHVHHSIVDLWLFISRECDYQHDSLMKARELLVNILQTIRIHLNTRDQSIQQSIFLSILQNLFCFIAHTRDIHCGLGHRQTTYMMLDAWYDCYPILAIVAFQTILKGNHSKYAYGSWRDICGFYDYCCKHSSRGFDHPLIDVSVRFMNSTLRKDWRSFKKKGTCRTNVAKWVPREKSHHSELYNHLACDWGRRFIPHIFSSATSVDAEFASIRKCKTNYRKMIVELTRIINPIEHKMCAKDDLSFVQMSVPNSAFANNWDRLREHNIQPISIVHEDTFYPPVTYGFSFPTHLDKFVKLAIRSIENTNSSAQNSEEITQLNAQWNFLLNKWYGYVDANAIAIIHIETVSIHDPLLHRAIAHACMIAQKSGVKRILFASHSPIWINLENCNGFVAFIRTIYHALHDQITSCSNLDHAISFLGENHPFSPIIITQTGHCYPYNTQPDFSHFFEIMDSKRYENMQNAYQNTVCINT